METVINNLDFRHFKLYLWTDSTIVLAWIHKPSYSWSTFVAHRVTKIVEKIGIDNWLHIDSSSNPRELGLLANE